MVMMARSRYAWGRRGYRYADRTGRNLTVLRDLFNRIINPWFGMFKSANALSDDEFRDRAISDSRGLMTEMLDKYYVTRGPRRESWTFVKYKDDMASFMRSDFEEKLPGGIFDVSLREHYGNDYMKDIKGGKDVWSGGGAAGDKILKSDMDYISSYGRGKVPGMPLASELKEIWESARPAPPSAPATKKETSKRK